MRPKGWAVVTYQAVHCIHHRVPVQCAKLLRTGPELPEWFMDTRLQMLVIRHYADKSLFPDHHPGIGFDPDAISVSGEFNAEQSFSF